MVVAGVVAVVETAKTNRLRSPPAFCPAPTTGIHNTLFLYRQRNDRSLYLYATLDMKAIRGPFLRRTLGATLSRCNPHDALLMAASFFLAIPK